MILKCEREHKHGNKLQNARGTNASITGGGPVPFHFGGWDLQSNTVVVVANMHAVGWDGCTNRPRSLVRNVKGH